jgi:hypothetical protein
MANCTCIEVTWTISSCIVELIREIQRVAGKLAKYDPLWSIDLAVQLWRSSLELSLKSWLARWRCEKRTKVEGGSQMAPRYVSHTPALEGL